MNFFHVSEKKVPAQSLSKRGEVYDVQFRTLPRHQGGTASLRIGKGFVVPFVPGTKVGDEGFGLKFEESTSKFAFASGCPSKCEK